MSRGEATNPDESCASARRVVMVGEFTGDAIQQAIDELRGHGGTVYLPPGRYLLRRGLRLPNGISLRGGSTNETVLHGIGMRDAYLISGDPGSAEEGSSRICDLTLDGGAGTSTGGVTGSRRLGGLYFVGTDEIEVGRVDVINMAQSGIVLERCRGARLIGVRLYAIGLSGITVYEGERIEVSNAVVSDVGLNAVHSGIQVEGVIGAYFGGRVSQCSGNAISLSSGKHPIKMVHINAVGENSRRGISLNGSMEQPLEQVNLTGRYQNNELEGIRVSNATLVSVTDAVVANNGGFGIAFQGRQGARDCLVAGCVFHRNKGDFAELHGSRDNIVFGPATGQPDISPPGKHRRKRAEGTDVDLNMLPSTMSQQDSGPQVTTTGREGDTVDDWFDGQCPVCGWQGRFEKRARSIRETYRCGACKATLRYQGQAQVLLEIYGATGCKSLAELTQGNSPLAEFHILEPGVLGPFREHFSQLPHYHMCEYWPGVPPGEVHDGVRCEDLMELTYENESFDLVVTSDIFEHVRRPTQAFREIYRILRPGGVHVFSIPVDYPLPETTHSRVDTSNSEDVLIDEPVYHSGPRGGKHLVYTDFGKDLPSLLGEMGYQASIEYYDVEGSDQASRLATFVARKPA